MGHGFSSESTTPTISQGVEFPVHKSRGDQIAIEIVSAGSRSRLFLIPGIVDSLKAL